MLQKEENGSFEFSREAFYNWKQQEPHGNNGAVLSGDLALVIAPIRFFFRMVAPINPHKQ